MRTNQKPSSGFTLVELMVVVTIIAILAAVATYAYGRITKRSRINEAVAFMAGVHAGEDLYYSDHQDFCGLAPNAAITGDGDWDPGDPGDIEGMATRWDSPTYDWSDCQINPPSHTRFRWILVADVAGSACVPPGNVATEDYGPLAIPACESIEGAYTATPTADWYYIVAQADQDGDGFMSCFGSSNAMTNNHWTIGGIELE